MISKEAKKAVDDNFVLRERSKHAFDEWGDESLEEIAARYKIRREVSPFSFTMALAFDSMYRISKSLRILIGLLTENQLPEKI